MKKMLLPLLALSIFFSCKKENGGTDYFLDFRPREVKGVFIVPGKCQSYSYEGKVYTDYLSFYSDTLKEENLMFSIQTSNYDPRILIAQEDSNYSMTSLLPVYFLTSQKMLDANDYSIENQIKSDYAKSSSTKTSISDDYDYGSMIPIEYRTTEIKDITITALNATLFGKQAGETLNDFFDIKKYIPAIIVSAPTKTLLYGNSSKEYPTSISEWLSLSPEAQTNMYLIPNTKIDNLPVSVQFVVKMETADGLVLRDTTRMITITE